MKRSTSAAPPGGRVGHQSGEDKAGSGVDPGGQHSGLFRRLHAAAPGAGVALDHDMKLRGPIGERGGETVNGDRAVGGDGKARDSAGQRLQPGKLGRPQDVEGDEDVVEAGIGHDFRLADLLAGDPLGAGLDLGPGEERQLVRLDMRARLDAMAVEMGLEAGDVAPGDGLVDDDGGRFGDEAFGRISAHGGVPVRLSRRAGPRRAARWPG